MHNIKCGEKCENFQMKIILLLLYFFSFFFAYFYAIFDCAEKHRFFLFFCKFSNNAPTCRQRQKEEM